MSEDITTLITQKETAEQEAARQKARADEFERQMMAYGERDTLHPDEATGPIHPNPVEEIFVALDKIQDTLKRFAQDTTGRLGSLELSVDTMKGWAKPFFEEAQRREALEARVVQLEQWKAAHSGPPPRCVDCPMSELDGVAEVGGG